MTRVLRRIPIESKNQVLALFFVAICMIETTLYEPSLLGEQGRLLLLLKLPIGILTGLMTAWAWHRPHSLAYKLTVSVLFIAYSVTGSVFRPWYLISTLELVLVFGFFFDPKPKIYWSYLAATFSVFFALFWWRWPNVPENSMRLSQADWVNIAIQMFFILALNYVLVLRVRSYQHRTEASFVAIGKHASRVTHDLKGMLSAPLLYLDHARATLAQNERATPELMENLAKTQKELSELHLAVSELSRLTSFESLPISKFSFSTCLHSTSLLFQRELALYKFKSEPLNFEVEADRSLVVALIFEQLSLLLSLPPKVSNEQQLTWSIEEDASIVKLQRTHLETAEVELLKSRFEESNLKNLASDLGTPLSVQTSRDRLSIQWHLKRIHV